MNKPLIPALGQTGDYEIRLLKVFKSVVECGGFSAAETELSVGRSTISIHIKNLEKRIGLKLCNRGRSGFSLTEEGLAVYRALRDLFSSLEEFRSNVNALHTRLTGELKIATSDAIVNDHRSKFQSVIAHFSDQAPEVKLIIETTSTKEIEKMILNGNADIGFISYSNRVEAIQYLDLYADKHYIYCSETHPIFNVSKDSIIESNLPKHNIIHSIINSESEITGEFVGLKNIYGIHSYESILSLILSGKYLGLLPESFVSEYVKNHQLKAILPKKKYCSLSIASITSSSKVINRPKTVFIEILSKLHANNQGIL